VRVRFSPPAPENSRVYVKLRKPYFFVIFAVLHPIFQIKQLQSRLNYEEVGENGSRF